MIASQLIGKIELQGASEAKKALSDIGEHTEKAGGFFKNLGSTAAGVFAGGALLEGVKTVIGSLGDFISEGQGANETIAATGAVLKSTGGAAGVTADMVSQLADKYMGLTGVQDDAVRGSENILLTYTHIGKNVFPQATQAALDLSARFGIDLTSASKLVGRALDDPTKASGTLSRYLGAMDSQTQKMIKTWVAHGDTAKAQAFILDQLNHKVGGAAEASGKANGGIKILDAEFTNIKQTIGQAIIKSLVPLAQQALPAVHAAASKVADIIQQVSGFIEHHQSVAKVAAIVIGVILVAAFVAWAISAGAAAVATIAATWPVLAIAAAIAGLAALVIYAYTHWGFFRKIVDTVRVGLGVLWGFIQSNVLPLLQKLGSFIGGVLGFIFAGFGKDIQIVTGFIGDLFSAIGNLLGTLGKLKDTIGNVFSHLPHLPGMATGGVTPGGPVLVGERGPEVILPPAGSLVVPADATQALLASVGSSAASRSLGSVGGGVPGGSGAAQTVTLVVPVQVGSREIARLTLPDLIKEIRLHTGMKI